MSSGEFLHNSGDSSKLKYCIFAFRLNNSRLTFQMSAFIVPKASLQVLTAPKHHQFVHLKRKTNFTEIWFQEFNFGTIPVNSCLPEKFHREGYSEVCGGSQPRRTRICASLRSRMKFKTLCYPLFGRNKNTALPSF